MNTNEAAAEGRRIPGTDLLRADAREDRSVSFAMRVELALEGLGVVEALKRERWQVWAGVAWPAAAAGQDDFAGAAVVFGERMLGAEPDGLAVLLEARVFRRIDADGAEGLADVLHAWSVRYALRSAWFAADEKSHAYSVRLRNNPSGRAVRLTPVEGLEDAEAEYLLGARVQRGRLLLDQGSARDALHGYDRKNPPPVRRAVWAALYARERWAMPG